MFSTFICNHTSSIPLSTNFLNRYGWAIDGTLTGYITLDQGGPWSNLNERVLLTPQIFGTATSSDTV